MAANVNVQLKKIIAAPQTYETSGVPKQITPGSVTTPTTAETHWESVFTGSQVELTSNFEYQAEFAQDPQRTATPEYIAPDSEATITITCRDTSKFSAILTAFNGDGTQYGLAVIGYGGAEYFYNVSGVARPQSQGGTPIALVIELKTYGDSNTDIYDFVTY
jgi:hypothetical protein